MPTVDGRDQGGLLDVELGPDYATSKLVYLSYYEPRDGGNGLAVARARFVDGAKPKLEELKVIFRMQPTLDSTKHAGGRLVFAPDGMLFVTLGERSILEGREQARDSKSHFGKIVRIAPDGTVPKDNPFVGKHGRAPGDLDPRPSQRARRRARRAGHGSGSPRWGRAAATSSTSSSGARTTAGRPSATARSTRASASTRSTQAPGLEQPVYYWDPVISPGALTIYSGDLFPEWKGNFLIAGLSSKALVRLTLKDDRVVGEETAAHGSRRAHPRSRAGPRGRRLPSD